MEEVSKFFHREILLLKSRKLGKKKSKSEVERKTREVWVESRRVASRLANWAPGIEPQTFATLDPVHFSLSFRECFLTTEQTLNLFTTTKRLTGGFFLQYQYAIQWGGGDKDIFNRASILSPTKRWRQQFSIQCRKKSGITVLWLSSLWLVVKTCAILQTNQVQNKGICDLLTSVFPRF